MNKVLAKMGLYGNPVTVHAQTGGKSELQQTIPDSSSAKLVMY